MTLQRLEAWFDTVSDSVIGNRTSDRLLALPNARHSSCGTFGYIEDNENKTTSPGERSISANLTSASNSPGYLESVCDDRQRYPAFAGTAGADPRGSGGRSSPAATCAAMSRKARWRAAVRVGSPSSEPSNIAAETAVPVR